MLFLQPNNLEKSQQTNQPCNKPCSAASPTPAPQASSTTHTRGASIHLGHRRKPPCHVIAGAILGSFLGTGAQVLVLGLVPHTNLDKKMDRPNDKLNTEMVPTQWPETTTTTANSAL